MSVFLPALNIATRSLVQPPANILNNITGAVAAYGLRKLNINYNGPAVRVRNSASGTEFDIGLNNDGTLNTTLLNSVIGANSAFVSIWYDQSGAGLNAVQTTQANQPRLVNAGTLETKNGKPAVRFLGIGGGLATINFGGPFDNAFTFSVVAQPAKDNELTGNSFANLALVAKTGVAAPSPFDYFTSVASGNTSFTVGNNSAQTLAVYNNYNKTQPLSVYTAQADGANSNVYFNGVFDNTRTLTAYGDSQQKALRIGSRNALDTACDGWISEAIFYGTANALQARRSVELDQMKYFGISSPSMIIISGDDYGVGIGATVLSYNAWPNALRSLLSTNVAFIINDSMAGMRIINNGSPSLGADNRASGAGGIDFRTDTKGATYIVQLGFNEINGGQDVATTYGQIKTLLANRKAAGLNYTNVLIATCVPAISTTVSNNLFSLNDCLRYGCGKALAQTGTLTTTQVQAIATSGELLNSTYGATDILDFAALSQFNTNSAFNNTTYYLSNLKNLTDAGYALMAAAAKTKLALT